MEATDCLYKNDMHQTTNQKKESENMSFILETTQ